MPNLQYRDLRHLGATDWARRGLSAHSLQNVLGHSSINTAQFYVNLVAQDIQDALDKAMESGSPMQPPPPSLADGAAQHSLNRTNRLQAAFKAKRAAQAHSTDSTKATKDIGVSVLQELEVEVESPSEVDATAVFLALHASLTRERQEDREELMRSNVIAFRPRKAA